jgi:ABC-2 type transport system permease protein
VAVNRRTRTGGGAALLTPAIVALLVAANMVASSSTQAWDLTQRGSNTLAPQSVLAARSLTSDVHVVGLFRPGVDNGQIETEALIALYAAQSPHVMYRNANPDDDTADVKRYGVTEVNTVVLDYRGKTELLVQGSQSEQDFTAGLLKLESNVVPLVCWGIGDGERDLKDSTDTTGYSLVADLLSKNSFATREVMLSQVASIPAECSELAVIDPTTALPDKAIAVIAAYLAGGGRLLLAAEPWAQDPTATASASALLKPYGQSFTGALVVESDPAHAASQDPTIPAVVDYGRSPITKDIPGVVSFFPRTTAIAGSPVEGATVVRLALSSSGAYAVAQPRASIARQAGDLSGPFTMMETIEQPVSGGKTRIVVVGTQAFAENRTLPPHNSDANFELALGSFQWLAGQDALIALPPKPARVLPLVLNADDQSTLIFITAVLMPGMIVVAGIAVWWRRRVTA